MSLDNLKIIGVVFLGALFCVSTVAQQPVDEAKVLQQVEALAKQHRAWGPAITTPGVTIEAKETGRKDVNGQTAVTYQVYVHGLPRDQRYQLLHWPLNGKVMTVLSDIKLEESGLATYEPKAEPLDLVLFAGRGEPKRFAIASQDGAQRAALTLIPFPVRGEDGGCALEAVLLTPDSEALLVQGSGFEADKEIRFQSVSEGEEHSGSLKTDNKGNLTTVILPYVVGKQKGQVQVTVLASTCKPKVKVAWGKGTYKVQ